MSRERGQLVGQHLIHIPHEFIAQFLHLASDNLVRLVPLKERRELVFPVTVVHKNDSVVDEKHLPFRYALHLLIPYVHMSISEEEVLLIELAFEVDSFGSDIDFASQ